MELAYFGLNDHAAFAQATARLVVAAKAEDRARALQAVKDTYAGKKAKIGEREVELGPIISEGGYGWVFRGRRTTRVRAASGGDDAAGHHRPLAPALTLVLAPSGRRQSESSRCSNVGGISSKHCAPFPKEQAAGLDWFLISSHDRRRVQ